MATEWKPTHRIETVRRIGLIERRETFTVMLLANGLAYTAAELIADSPEAQQPIPHWERTDVGEWRYKGDVAAFDSVNVTPLGCVDCGSPRILRPNGPITALADGQPRCSKCFARYFASFTKELERVAKEAGVPWESVRNMRVADFAAQVDRKRGVEEPARAVAPTGPRCTCGYAARSQADFDEHVLAVIHGDPGPHFEVD
jgi:hypothetical protein